jgi:hypothetical protein
MPIPFRDADEIAELGASGYLTIRPLANGRGFEGALLLTNARGEPLEFSYNRVEMPPPFLWRREDIRRQAQRGLTASLLSICSATPGLLFALAREVGSELFCQDIQVALPICRMAPSAERVSVMAGEVQEPTVTSDPLNLFWFPAPPAGGSTERRLLEALAGRGLLLEPFERAKRALDEVYKGREEA